MKFKSIVLSDPGKERANNEDNYYVNNLSGLFAVFDGMGGAEDGEVASSTAAGILADYDKKDQAASIDSFIYNVNKAVVQECEKSGASLIGTTLAMVVFHDGFATVVNVGDSRVYSFSDRTLRQLSTDHTLVYQMYLSGSISKEEARQHPRAHVLYQHIGMKEGAGPEPSIAEVGVKAGDRFLICSDGLTDMLSDEQIEEIFIREEGIEEAAQKIFEGAMDAGGKDNITIIFVSVEEI